MHQIAKKCLKVTFRCRGVSTGTWPGGFCIQIYRISGRRLFKRDVSEDEKIAGRVAFPHFYGARCSWGAGTMHFYVQLGLDTGAFSQNQKGAESMQFYRICEIMYAFLWV